MLPREGTETFSLTNFASAVSVNNPCYLERGRKLALTFPFIIYDIVNNPCYLERGRKHNLFHDILLSVNVNNPCYLERGRKPKHLSNINQLHTKLITHVTSRGDGNSLEIILRAILLVNNPCYLERGRKL